MTDFGSDNWRLVCHKCGFRFERGLAFNTKDAPCCSDPEVHLHGLDKPCEWCDDSKEAPVGCICQGMYQPRHCPVHGAPCATCGKPGHTPMGHAGWHPDDERR